MTKSRDRTVASEQIYDALFDEEAFSQLPNLLARMVGARSAALVWRFKDGDTRILHHNGYFSDADYADYAANYANGDPWIAVAHRAGRMNKAICMDEEVGAATVRRTAFYADWLRGMGDDTLHCLGAATTVRDGEGIIGLQRGESASGPFTQEEARRLASVLPHLARVLVLRGRLATAARQTLFATSALDSTGMAMIVVDARGRVRLANAAAEDALARGLLRARYVNGVLSPCAALERAIALATNRTDPSATLVALDRADGKPLAANVTPFASGAATRAALITFRHASAGSTRADGLRQLFDLTAAEANVACRLADGQTLQSIADQRGSSLATVKTQLKTIAGKMRCSRQADVIVAINSLPL